MRPTEKIVAGFLTRRGYIDVRYEPDGNVPPDFLVDGRIAIEARVLNQQHVSNGRSEGLEEVEIPLTQKIENLLKSFGPPTQGGTWFVAFRFRRPVEKWKTLEPKIRAELLRFQNGTRKLPAVVAINDRFDLEFMLEGSPHDSFYLLGSYDDEEAGGWVISELVRNLAIVVQDKAEKVAPYRHKYPEWWLVLPDYIGFGLGDPMDQRRFREAPALVHNWDRIILVSPTNLNVSFEV